ncbi:Eukaryotic translation initiation factor 3 subunit C [Yarrowia sp. E02]|nr:Eukaryotic translation initiation factor 3 subunit C [Yarrowia sp. E02]
MSRFFAGGSDSDDSSSDEDLYGSGSESGSDFSQDDQDGGDNEDDMSDDSMFADDSDDSDDDSDDDDMGGKGASYFLKSSTVADSDDEEDTGKKTVLSAKDKLLAELANCSKLIDNGKRINDWVLIQGEFDKLNKAMERFTKQRHGLPPKVYVQCIVELEEFLTEQQEDKAAIKKMNASNSRAFNTVKQRVRKNNKEYEVAIAKFKSGEDEEEEEEEEDNKPKPKAKDEFVLTAPSQASNEEFTTVGKAGKALVSPSDMFKTLKAVLEGRGKKNTDREDQVRQLENLLPSASTVYQKISVYTMLVSTRLDLSSASAALAPENWLKVVGDLNDLLSILEANIDTFHVIETAPEIEDIEKGPVAREDGVKLIPGSVASLVERVDDEFTKALQFMDPHTTEYVDRLRDETKLYQTLLRVQMYIEHVSDEKDTLGLARILVRRVDHLYFKPNNVINMTEQIAWAGVKGNSKATPRPTEKDLASSTYPTTLISNMCSVLYKQSNTVFRTKAMLAHVYHYALNDEYYKARDMFLMSHLQSSIASAEPQLQVLFNRTLVQLGLCAFRNGLIAEAQQSLQEVCSSPRLKELLGQGLAKYAQAGVVDKQRVLPFHTHINLELLECVFLCSSLLMEVPFMAAHNTSIDAKKKVISKLFRRMLDYHERQVFCGPPENTRDHIMQAAKALQRGDWEAARDLVCAIKIWSLLPNPEAIKAMLTDKLQIEGLRTYLFTYWNHYSTLSLSTLADMFQLPVKDVAAIVAKMIAQEELSGSLDQKTNSVVFTQAVQQTKLQQLAVALSDKVIQLAERNERLVAGGYQFDKMTQPQKRKTQRAR